MSDQLKKSSTDWIGFAALSVATSFLMGFLVLIWQIYSYLRIDVWSSVSPVDVLRWAGVSWAVFPTDWLGLYRVMDWMPLSLFVPAVGILFAFLLRFQEEGI